ncbi:hypothetical protein RUND412_008966 [Rhizina undulata]
MENKSTHRSLRQLLRHKLSNLDTLISPKSDKGKSPLTPKTPVLTTPVPPIQQINPEPQDEFHTAEGLGNEVSAAALQDLLHSLSVMDNTMMLHARSVYNFGRKLEDYALSLPQLSGEASIHQSPASPSPSNRRPIFVGDYYMQSDIRAECFLDAVKFWHGWGEAHAKLANMLQEHIGNVSEECEPDPAILSSEYKGLMTRYNLSKVEYAQVEKNLVDEIIVKYTTHASDLLSRTLMASESSYKPIACLKKFGNTRKPREPTTDNEMCAKLNSQSEMGPSPATTLHKKVRIQETVPSTEDNHEKARSGDKAGITSQPLKTPKKKLARESYHEGLALDTDSDYDLDNRLRQENGSPVPKHLRRNFHPNLKSSSEGKQRSLVGIMEEPPHQPMTPKSSQKPATNPPRRPPPPRKIASGRRTLAFRLSTDATKESELSKADFHKSGKKDRDDFSIYCDPEKSEGTAHRSKMPEFFHTPKSQPTDRASSAPSRIPPNSRLTDDEWDTPSRRKREGIRVFIPHLELKALENGKGLPIDKIPFGGYDAKNSRLPRTEILWTAGFANIFQSSGGSLDPEFALDFHAPEQCTVPIDTNTREEMRQAIRQYHADKEARVKKLKERELEAILRRAKQELEAEIELTITERRVKAKQVKRSPPHSISSTPRKFSKKRRGHGIPPPIFRKSQTNEDLKSPTGSWVDTESIKEFSTDEQREDYQACGSSSETPVATPTATKSTKALQKFKSAFKS